MKRNRARMELTSRNEEIKEIDFEEEGFKLDEKDLEEEDEFELDEKDLEEEDEFELDEEDLEEENEFELDEEDLEEENEFELDEEDLEEEDEFKSNEEDLEEEDAPELHSTKQNVGLTVSADAKKELDEQLEEFLTTKVKTFSNVGNKGSSFLSVVKADSGTGIRLTKGATAKLNNPMQVSIGFTGSYLVLCNADGLDVSSYKGSFKKDRTTIYNTGLVDAIIKQFNLDFSNKTSISFNEGYYKQQGRTILYVKLS